MNFTESPAYFKVFNASAGSGKTFILVKNYLKILIESEPKIFQSILAITFTNKAAAEMKERVLSNLRKMALGIPSDIGEIIEEELGLSKAKLKEKSEVVLKEIIKNYSAFQIVTIDTFTHKVIRSFALELGLTTNFDIELDEALWLNEAIENVLAQVGVNEEITRVILDFALSQAEDDRSWDIARELQGLAQIIHNENHIPYLDALQHKSVNDYWEFKKSIKENQFQILNQLKEIGEKGLYLIDLQMLAHHDFYYSMLPKHFLTLRDNPKNSKFFEDNKLKEKIDEEAIYSKSKPQTTKDKIEGILPGLKQLYFESEKLWKNYLLNQLLLKSITPLAVLSEINKALIEIKQENNIQFLSEFNRLISRHLVDQPAAFIYEKIGERFKFFFIDEMQDTSVMQWKNLIPLIENALAGGNSGLLLVGDAKQSIYRWRGGEPEQFIQLANFDEEIIEASKEKPFFIPKKVLNLERNFRSFSEVINFNNDYFTHLADHFENDHHAKLYQIGNRQLINKKEGGFVQIQFLEEITNEETRNKVVQQKVLEIIENLAGKVNRNEICILVRTGSQGASLANFLSEQNIPVTSADSLLLKSDRTVSFLIDLLVYLGNSENGDAKFNFLYFLHEFWQIDLEMHDFFAEIVPLNLIETFDHLKDYGLKDLNFLAQNLSLYDQVEQILRSFGLLNISRAYIQNFLEVVLNFGQKKSQSLQAFLEFWELKQDKLTVSASENKEAINILTIHKSKGLEFRVVIVPFEMPIVKKGSIKDKRWIGLKETNYFDRFEHFYVQIGKSLSRSGDQGEALVSEFDEQQLLDNFNLLYVAYTRAIEQLYILNEVETKGKTLSTTQFTDAFLKEKGIWENGKLIFEFGKNLEVHKKPDNEQENILLNEFVSTSWQSHDISIATSAIWQKSENEDARGYGTLVHEILALIFTATDVKRVLRQYQKLGKIDINQYEELSNLLIQITTHPELKTYFLKNKKIFTERELLTSEKEILIPDRLIFEEKNVVIIDYKTGKEELQHQQQISRYGLIISEMGFTISRKILVYLQKDIRIIEVN